MWVEEVAYLKLIKVSKVHSLLPSVLAGKLRVMSGLPSANRCECNKAAQRPRAKLPGGCGQHATYSHARRRAKHPTLWPSPPGQLQRVVGRHQAHLFTPAYSSTLSSHSPTNAWNRSSCSMSKKCPERSMTTNVPLG